MNDTWSFNFGRHSYLLLMAQQKKAARQHHWISQCYLKEFTDTQKKSGLITVLNVENGNVFRAIPRNVGGQRDFNRIDVPGHPIDAIETAMSGFESEVASSIESIKSRKDIQNATDLNVLLNFIALLAARNPKGRAHRHEFKQRVAMSIMDMVLSTEKRFNHTMESAKKSGDVTASENISYEEMRKFYESNEFSIEVSNESQIQEEIELQDAVLQALGRRSWTLFQAAEDHQFVTCDHPVVLTPNKSQSGPVRLGFGLPNTLVYFPITPELATIGYHATVNPTVAASPDLVAYLNYEITAAAQSQVYSRSPDFMVFNSILGKNLTGSELAKFILSRDS